MPDRSLRPSRIFLAVGLAFFLIVNSTALAATVDNFVLLDHKGGGHELFYDKSAKAIVIMIQGNGCPIVRNAWPTFSDIRDRYEQKGVKFLMLNANLQDDRDSIAAEAEMFGFDLPILGDDMDGFVTREEMAGSRWSRLDVGEFAEADNNGDGKLSYSEYAQR